MPSTPDEEPGSLADAYERRTTQLYEARGALAEAVATLEAELRRRHEEAEGLRSELAGCREYAESLEAEARKERGHAEQFRQEVARLEAELAVAQKVIAGLEGMKVVRWTAGPRRLVYRLRERGK
jgi:predicted RNase H-like nuclease (RuvC/YqgF family)